MPFDSSEADDSDNEGPEMSVYKNALVRRFDFSSSLQRMSVVCKNELNRRYGTSPYKVFVKGSPEKICELCRPETMPLDYEDVLANYTMQGYRVIALSMKNLP